MKIVILALLVLTSCMSPRIDEGFLKEEVNLTKEKSDLYFSIGRNYQDRNMTGEAIENYQEAITIDPTNSRAHFALGKLLLDKKFTDRGIAQIEKAVLVNPTFTEARNYLAYLYYKKFKNFKKAKRMIDVSVEDLTYWNQEESWALKLKLDYKLLGKRKIKNTALKVLALKAQNCVHRLDIAQTFYKMSFYKKALESARLADNLCLEAKEKAHVAFLKGLIFIKKNDYLVAEEILRGIAPESESFKKMLDRTKTAVRKKINSGI